MSALTPPTFIASFFRLLRCIGRGSFGEVYEAVDTRTRARVAVKLEPVHVEFPQLVYEHCVMQELAGCHGFPRVLWFESNDTHNVLIMQKLGESVEDARVRRSGVLPVERVVGLGRQMLERLASFHARGFAYRDMKPQNMLLGLPAKRRDVDIDGTFTEDDLYLIDFGLCKRVFDVRTSVHIPMRTDKKRVGTPRYASLNAHDGVEQSRRDDIESLVYVLVFLARGCLPWQIQAQPQADQADACADVCMDKLIRRIAAAKRSITVDQLCDGLPEGFKKTLHYARGLPFDAMPDYTFLQRLWT